MLNASVGVHRVLGRLRRPPSPQSAIGPELVAHEARRPSVVRRVRRGLVSIAAATHLVPARAHPDDTERVVRVQGRSVVGRLGPDRAVAIAVVGVLVGASVVSISIGRAAPNTGGTTGAGTAPRIAVGGDLAMGGYDSAGTIEFGQPDPTSAAAGSATSADGAILAEGNTSAQGAAFTDAVPHGGTDTLAHVDVISAPGDPVDIEGPFSDDGTLLKPTAVDTTVRDGSALVKTYTVKANETLPAIASKFAVSTMSVVWANNLKSKTDIHAGEVLRIPPVTGLILKVTPTDTLDGIAARYDVNGIDILAVNGLDDPNLVVGQVLVVPGAEGAAIVVPKTSSRTTTRTSGTVSNVRPPSSYTGGKLLWPVVGGGNYISQYFHYGHWAIDIAADYGSEVRAAAAGIVTFAGWKNNGGGYQVWIAHGSGLYTTYNHMSAITVGAGQHVARGQQVGKIGMTGDATGPHCHFEVWRGPIWNGGTRVNPLGYF